MPSFIVVPLSIVVLLPIVVLCFILEQLILDKKLDFDNILWYHQLRPDLRGDLTVAPVYKLEPILAYVFENIFIKSNL